MSEALIPKPVTAIEAAFGNISQLPSMEDIPDEFKNGRSPWCKLFSMWFFFGLKDIPAVKPGINSSAAIGTIRACMASFQPKHAHKEAGCAYLMSLWLDESALKIKPNKKRP